MPVIPNPAQGAALRRLGMLRTDELPVLAANWLVAHDSQSLRRLAGIDGADVSLIDQLWPAVLAELGTATVAGDPAWDLAMTFQLAAWRQGDRTSREVMSAAMRAYIENDYPDYPREAAVLYGLDDELDGGWGRLRDEVLAEIEQTLADWANRLNPHS